MTHRPSSSPTVTRVLRAAAAALALLTAAGCVRVAVHGTPPSNPPPPMRIATYNTSLYSEEAGGLVRRLEAGDPDARKVAAVLQRVRPDLVLLNEFDHDADGRAADLFQQRYLGVAQPGGGEPLAYPYRFFAPVNTGVPSGLDLDRNGTVGGTGRARGNDAWGYGLHPGQYGMLVLSRHPIDPATVRTFQHLRWSTMPGARRPVDPATGTPWYDEVTWPQMRLSSKSHWDVPVSTPHGVIHFLVSHPTPPVFDGPEDRNGARNGDEIRLWQRYLDDPRGEARWLCDDQGRCGGLPDGARFVIAGDLNNDPVDGDGDHDAIVGLLEHPRVLRMATPRSLGAEQAALRDGGVNLRHRGAHAHDTGNFGPRTGNLRVDYVLPSVGLPVAGSGVFWPTADAPEAAIADATDHHLVWVDLAPPR